MAAITTTTTNSEASGRSIVRIVTRNTAFMMGGQILIKVFAFIFSVYVVRTLGAEHFGQYAAALAYVSIFAMLTDLGTSALSVREMARQKENSTWMVPDIMSLRIVLSFVAIVIVTASAWGLGRTPIEVLGIFIASCSLLLYAFQGPLDSVMIAQERLDFSSVFRLIDKLIFMILGTVLLLLGMGYIGLLLATLAGILVMGVASGYVTRYVLKLSFTLPNPRNWWSLLVASFPFGVSGAANEFSRRFDTVFMSFVLLAEHVGWYNVPLNMILTMMLMAQSLAMAMYPTMVKEYDSGRGSIQGTVQRAIRYLLIFSFPIAVGGMLVADILIPVLYGQEFIPSVDVMRILVWVLPCMFLAEILGRTSSTLHLERKTAWINIVTAILSVVLTIILVPRFDIVGAAVAMLITRLCNIVMSCMVIGPPLLFKGNILPLLRIVISGAVMGLIVWLVRGVPFIVRLDDIIELMVVVGAGALSYTVTAVVCGAVTRGELRYVSNAAYRRLRTLGRKRGVACAS